MVLVSCYCEWVRLRIHILSTPQYLLNKSDRAKTSSSKSYCFHTATHHNQSNISKNQPVTGQYVPMSLIHHSFIHLFYFLFCIHLVCFHNILLFAKCTGGVGIFKLYVFQSFVCSKMIKIMMR